MYRYYFSKCTDISFLTYHTDNCIYICISMKYQHDSLRYSTFHGIKSQSCQRKKACDPALNPRPSPPLFLYEFSIDNNHGHFKRIKHRLFTLYPYFTSSHFIRNTYTQPNHIHHRNQLNTGSHKTLHR